MHCSQRPVCPILVMLVLGAPGAAVFAGTRHDVPAVYATIQAAIDVSVDGDEVVVAPGTWDGFRFRTAAIAVRSTDPADPAIVAATIINAGGVNPAVVFPDGSADGSLLAGLTITNGRNNEGAGIYVLNSSPIIWRNVITGNTASQLGGGIYCSNSGARITNNTISGNSASGGGGIYCQGGSPCLTDNIIAGNQGTNGGAGMTLDNTMPFMTGNQVIDNSSDFGEGGGVYAYATTPTAFVNNTISGNAAGGGGGGLVLARCVGVTISGCLITGNNGEMQQGGGCEVLDNSWVWLTNDTIAGNGAYDGGNIYADSGTHLRNCIVALAFGGSGIAFREGFGDYLYESYSDVYGNAGGNYSGTPDPTGTNGNISADPLFANAAAGDYRLKSNTGRWNGASWVKDTVFSPCLDAGDPTSGWANEPSPSGGRINMGYDGNTIYASKTPTPKVLTATPPRTGAMYTAPFTATFSVPMHRASVQSAFSISPAKTGTFSWLGKKLTFTPATHWTAGQWYTVTIARAARSAAGVSMAAAFTWQFRTGAPVTTPAVTIAAAPSAAGCGIVTTVAAPASVGVTICNLAGHTVAVLPGRDLPTGASTLLWNRRSTSGTLVPAGQYLVRVSARAADGSQAQAVATVRLQ